MSFNVDLLIGDIEQLARGNDFSELEQAVASLVDHIRDAKEAPSATTMRRVLVILRGKRQFGAMIEVAGALEAKGFADHRARLLHAQALIDTIAPQSAPADYGSIADKLEKIASEVAADSSEFKEAVGLIGRVSKQHYIDTASKPPTAADAIVLQRAIGAYARVAARGNFAQDHWHFINFVACTARAERDGVHPGHDADSRTLASVLIDVLGVNGPSVDADIWTLASLGEAYLALGRLAEAGEAYRLYMAGAGTDVFELFSSMRQLVELWGLKRGSGPGGEIVELLENRISELLAKQVILAESDVRRLERMGALAHGSASGVPPMGEVLEHAGRVRLEGATDLSSAILTLDYVLRVVDRATAVARIKERFMGRHVGTGFLVRGAELHAPLGADIFLLTNNHVAGRLPGARLNPRHIEIELKDRRGRTVSLNARDEDIVWESRVDQLDATLLKLQDVPGGFEPLPLVVPGAFPDDLSGLVEGERQFFIAGAMGDLQHSVCFCPYSIHDLGWRDGDRPDEIFIHHNAPTRDGTSGSPLFSRDWRVIGLHRAGTEENSLLPALGGRVGDRVAKVAVSINAIRRAIAETLSAPLKMDVAAPFMQDKEVLGLLEAERASEETLAQYVEWDETRSEPFKPMLRRRPNADGTVPQGAMTDAWWNVVAASASAGFQARRNYRFQPKAPPAVGLTIVSDGDSWFQFPVPGVADTIDHLRETHSVYCHAIAGSVLAATVAQAHERILPSIKSHKPDAVILSGGGNDILGFGAINLFVSKYREGADAAALLKSGLEQTLDAVGGHYETWIERVLDASGSVRIFCHGYDWSLPAEPVGRWLYKPLSGPLGIKDVQLQREIVRIIIDRHNERMKSLETKYPGQVFHVDCRGAVGGTRNAWYDELHPRSPGFGRVAARFNRRIAEAFAGDERVVGIA